MKITGLTCILAVTTCSNVFVQIANKKSTQRWKKFYLQQDVSPQSDLIETHKKFIQSVNLDELTTVSSRPFRSCLACSLLSCITLNNNNI